MSSLESWREEVRSAWLYRAMASAETDAARREMFLGLAMASEDQASTWVDIARREGVSLPAAWSPDVRARLVAGLVKRLGPRKVLPALAAMKVRGLSAYGPRAHVEGEHPLPKSLSDFGQRHRGVASGGTLRAAVFGVNDGLVSNASLIMGVAGAGQEPHVVLLSGVAGLLAGALSMAAGEYVSVRSQRELYEYQIGLERDELAQYPEAEAEEMALIYHARGVPLAQGRRLAQELLEDPERALDVLAREELGLNPDELGSPWVAAVTSLLSFAIGAFVPLVPFVLTIAPSSVAASAVLTAAALFGVGCALSLFTGRGALRSGLRMLLIGGGAGLVTFLVGKAFGIGLA